MSNILKYQNPSSPLLIQRVNQSGANFVKRLLDPNRKSIPDWETKGQKIATHKMSWGEDERGAYVFPEVQEIDGQLIDFSRPPYTPGIADYMAHKNNNIIRMSPEEADWFTRNYKQHYPSFKKGGRIHIKKKNRGKFTEYCGGKVTEECITKGKKSKDPKIRKRATFAANARKWKHENGGIIKYQNPNSPLFNPHKIIENVPAREWGPRKINEDGTITEGNGTKFSRAPFQYWGNKGLGLQNEKLARDLVSDFTWMMIKNPNYNPILDKNYQSYDDAINYLNHLEGLKKYLGLPYDTGLLMESKYKPTRLQGTNEKTYKFKSSTVPGYWDDVVDDMVIGEYDKNQYYDQSLNEFTAYRDRDEKGDFVSIYDEWDYNPAVRGGNKKLNKVIDSVTGGKPFVIYDRIYLDDHYDVPEEARGNPFITPAVVTANAKHENGGVLKAQEGTPYGLPGGAPSYMQVQPFSPVGIALNQAKAMAKTKREQHLPSGVKEVVGPNGKKVAIRTEQPLVPLEQSIAEWLPGTGDVAEVGYIADDVKNGRYGSAALAAAMVALPGNVRKVFRESDVPTSKLTEAERLGIPKGERSNPKALDNPQYWGYEQWNERYNVAVRAGNWEEVQRLRDLHFKRNAPNTKVVDEKGMPRHMYHGEEGRNFKGKPYRYTTFEGVNWDLEDLVEKGATQNHWRLSKPNYERMGNYHTPEYRTALSYAWKDPTLVHDDYLNITNPFTWDEEEIHQILLKTGHHSEKVLNKVPGHFKMRPMKDINGNFIKNQYGGVEFEKGEWIPDKFSFRYPQISSWTDFAETPKVELMKLGYDGLYIPQYYDSYGAFVSPSQFKSADPITWDGKGEIIPIVKRDNFRNLDTRYEKGGKL